MNPLRPLFLLDPEISFLNHGSFGAMPRTILETYQEWQRRLERQPVRFMVDELLGHLAASRAALGKLVHADPDDLVFVPNATFAVNAVARSLELGRGDEVLGTDHEYGACNHVWEFLSVKRGFRYVRTPVPVPVRSAEDLLERIWEGVTPRTRLLFVSHITSPTAIRFPVEALCARAREAGILTLIDGAHAVGQIPLDLEALGADFYTSNCHKWLLCPKGTAFLHAHRTRQPLIEPLVVSWGWGDDRAMSTGSDFLDSFQWRGTDEFAGALTVPAAIAFQEEHDWEVVRAGCHALLAQTLARIEILTGLPPVYPGNDLYAQMGTALLPPGEELIPLQARLWRESRVEVPLMGWNDRRLIRVSIQGYNTEDDADRLLEALGRVLGAPAGGR